MRRDDPLLRQCVRDIIFMWISGGNRKRSPMKKLTLWLMALAALPGSALEAQNIAGNWQGTLQAGQQKVRIVFKIALENDKLQATLHIVDQPAPPFATTITRDGSPVKMRSPP